MRTLVEGTATNVGDSVPTNVARRLSWDAAADLGTAGAFINASIYIAANDGRGLVDLAFVTLPANVPTAGDPALTISSNVVGDLQLLPFWLWLVASNDAGITFANGEVRAASGPLAGQLLASGTTTTAVGREFAFARLGVREATAAEAQRARTGTTPGIQQYNPTRFYGTVPDRVNEIGVETGSTPGVHVVRLN
jgi:hypothetical protein